jgi:two-component system sensor histidine kinase SenX3
MSDLYAYKVTTNLNPEVAQLIEHLPGIVILLNKDHDVVYASEESVIHDLIRQDKIVLEELSGFLKKLPAQFKKTNGLIESIRPNVKTPQQLEIDAIQVLGDHILLMIQDQTANLRIEAMRRDFIANISHELKTPVGALELLSEAIRESGNDAESVKRFAEKIPKETKRLANLIKDIIDLSRIQSDDPLQEPEVVSINKVVEDALDSVESIASKNGVHIMTQNDTNINIMGDSKQLVTALKNLLINAIFHTGDDNKILLKVKKTSDFVEVSVIDSGEGISPEDQLRIFERFYRVDSSRSRQEGGSGIGLSLVKHICSNHGGSALVESSLGKGAMFTMQLPLNSPGDSR